jgi:hypothetical protein
MAKPTDPEGFTGFEDRPVHRTCVLDATVKLIGECACHAHTENTDLLSDNAAETMVHKTDVVEVVSTRCLDHFQ